MKEEKIIIKDLVNMDEDIKKLQIFMLKHYNFINSKENFISIKEDTKI